MMCLLCATTTKYYNYNYNYTQTQTHRQVQYTGKFGVDLDYFECKQCLATREIPMKLLGIKMENYLIIMTMGM
jgi:hypothetical protein